MLTREQERWAEALMVLNQHGEQADEFIGQRMRSLALDGDQAGVDRWMAIAAKVDQCREGTVQ